MPSCLLEVFSAVPALRGPSYRQHAVEPVLYNAAGVACRSAALALWRRLGPAHSCGPLVPPAFENVD